MMEKKPIIYDGDRLKKHEMLQIFATCCIFETDLQQQKPSVYAGLRAFVAFLNYFY